MPLVPRCVSRTLQVKFSGMSSVYWWVVVINIRWSKWANVVSVRRQDELLLKFFLCGLLSL